MAAAQSSRPHSNHQTHEQSRAQEYASFDPTADPGCARKQSRDPSGILGFRAGSLKTPHDAGLGFKSSDADKRHLRTPFGRVSRRLRGGVCGELLLIGATPSIVGACWPSLMPRALSAALRSPPSQQPPPLRAVMLHTLSRHSRRATGEQLPLLVAASSARSVGAWRPCSANPGLSLRPPPSQPPAVAARGAVPDTGTT